MSADPKLTEVRFHIWWTRFSLLHQSKRCGSSGGSDLASDVLRCTLVSWSSLVDHRQVVRHGGQDCADRSWGNLHGGVSGAGITQTSVPFRSVSHRVVSTRSCTGLGASRRHRAVAGGVSSAWVCSSGSISSRITTWKIETDALRGMLGKALRWWSRREDWWVTTASHIFRRWHDGVDVRWVAAVGW